MTLRLIQVSNALPFSWPVDPSAEFQAGMIGQLWASGNQVVCGVSDGTAPLGIIDDYKTHAFTSASIDEEHIVNIPSYNITTVNGHNATQYEIKLELDWPHIYERSFLANIPLILTPRNGVVTIPANTVLNYDQAGSGTPDSVKFLCNYTYQIPNVPGDDSTFASGRVTLWVNKMIAATDQFETNVSYALNANLFVSENGVFTTRRTYPDQPAIAIVTGPPNAANDWLEFCSF